MRTLKSYVIIGQKVTIHETTEGWVALGYSNDGLPSFSSPITEKEARTILETYEYHEH